MCSKWHKCPENLIGSQGRTLHIRFIVSLRVHHFLPWNEQMNGANDKNCVCRTLENCINWRSPNWQKSSQLCTFAIKSLLHLLLQVRPSGHQMINVNEWGFICRSTKSLIKERFSAQRWGEIHWPQIYGLLLICSNPLCPFIVCHKKYVQSDKKGSYTWLVGNEEPSTDGSSCN